MPQLFKRRLAVTAAIFAGVAALLLVLGPLVFGTHLEGQRVDIAFIFSELGGKRGVPWLILAIILSLGVALRSQRRLTDLVIVVGLLAIALPSIAELSEHGLKNLFAVPRPCHEQMYAAGVIPDLPTFYELDKAGRSSFLAEALATGGPMVGGISLSEEVREHWIEETGFSFPSVHALMAFFFCSFLFGWALGRTPKPLYPVLFMLPLLAAAISLSRVTLWMHRPIDIAAGAVMGTVMGSLLLMVYIRVARRVGAIES